MPSWFNSPASRLYHYLMTACGLVAALLFGAMGMLVCADILLRNIGWGSIPASVETTEYMLMGATFIAAPWLLYVGDHIRIDIVLRACPAALRHMLDTFTDLIGLAICVILTWQSLIVMRDSAAQGGMVFKVLIFPEWWLNLPMLFATTLLSMEFARRLVRGVLARRSH